MKNTMQCYDHIWVVGLTNKGKFMGMHKVAGYTHFGRPYFSVSGVFYKSKEEAFQALDGLGKISKSFKVYEIPITSVTECERA